MLFRSRNPPGTQKPWTIAHKNGQKCLKSRILTMPLQSCTGGHGASKSSRDPKTVDYSPRKQSEMPEITSFDDAARVVYRGVTRHRNPPGTRKSWTIAHENGQKCSKSRVLTMPLQSCTGGHRALKSSRELETVDYSPRKRPEMTEITSFDYFARVVDRGSRGIEILPGNQNRGL